MSVDLKDELHRAYPASSTTPLAAAEAWRRGRRSRRRRQVAVVVGAAATVAVMFAGLLQVARPGGVAIIDGPVAPVPAAVDPIPAGQVLELGQLRVLSDDGAGGVRPGGQLFATRDGGWCFKVDDELGCAPSKNGVSGYVGLGAQPEELTCLHVAAPSDVLTVTARADKTRPAQLHPLTVSAETPWTVFATCWTPPIDPETVTAVGHRAEGDRVELVLQPVP